MGETHQGSRGPGGLLAVLDVAVQMQPPALGLQSSQGSLPCTLAGWQQAQYHSVSHTLHRLEL